MSIVLVVDHARWVLPILFISASWFFLLLLVCFALFGTLRHHCSALLLYNNQWCSGKPGSCSAGSSFYDWKSESCRRADSSLSKLIQRADPSLSELIRGADSSLSDEKCCLCLKDWESQSCWGTCQSLSNSNCSRCLSLSDFDRTLITRSGRIWCFCLKGSST